ncbi:hypothetical protein SLA2020_336000 [Shorea laevis]
MLNFLCKTIVHGTHYTTRAASTVPKSLLLARNISSTSNQLSFTVSYLVNSCSLSPETALSASKYVNFETPDRADLVITFFKSHGFSQTQISNVIGRVPSVLLSEPEKTLLPKLEFFYSKGFTSPDIAGVLSRSPAILDLSLENHIVLLLFSLRICLEPMWILLLLLNVFRVFYVMILTLMWPISILCEKMECPNPI